MTFTVRAAQDLVDIFLISPLTPSLVSLLSGEVNVFASVCEKQEEDRG